MTEELTSWTEPVMSWLTTEGLGLARNVLVFVLVLAAGYLVARIARRATKAAFENSRLQPSPLFQRFVVNVAGKATLLIAFIIALGNLGVDTSALIAGLGVSGLVLGFALKDTLSNFASGMLILLYRPFDVGHFVEVGGLQGTVKDLTLVSTLLTTPDNKQVMIPNAKVWGNPVTNYSATGTRRLEIIAGVAYDADIDEATTLLLDVLSRHEKVLDEPAPAVVLGELGPSSVDFKVRGWVDTADYWSTHNELLREVKYRLDEAGIGIPFPQQEVWMHQVVDDPQG